MSTTTKISLVGTAIASVASLLYAIYRKTEENRELREENIRMEERAAYAPVPSVHKSKKHKRYKPKRVHWEYDRYSNEWVLVDGKFEDPYEDMYRQEDSDDTIYVHGHPTPPPQPQYYQQPYERPVERVIYNGPVYDPYGNEINIYFRGNPYNQMNCRQHMEYQTPYPNQYNRSYEPVGYAWGDPYSSPYYGNVKTDGYCPGYAYNQVL